MLRSLKEFEKEMDYIKTDIETIRSNYATKEDIQSVKDELHKALSMQTWKIILALVITVFIAVLSETFII
ncbi:TPA: hypothetical protein PXS19_002475 [Yersinia enterocolitica]|uniref:hypothetical protein n=1 Tax=Yersinia enterocolitica TaxID=630 RepID=UPI0005064BE2|nr:hypothetical protein [Yersinia enterocolitica]KGA78567.1 hypothetical protein DJ60_969 [Yersinia enterocolitica]HDL6510091.1 hypothetical protein [Yersinia enterocolitica]HDL7604524.1 hypothetical protein [Yersinia enterocolitica]HDL7612543.1 hypothetical protein [Yersinia enterocolitica]HDL7641192.1 hypothetical protein [Yersinia enterocolitica]